MIRFLIICNVYWPTSFDKKNFFSRSRIFSACVIFSVPRTFLFYFIVFDRSNVAINNAFDCVAVNQVVSTTLLPPSFLSKAFGLAHFGQSSFICIQVVKRIAFYAKKFLCAFRQPQM